MNASHPIRPLSPRRRVPLWLWLWLTLSLTTIAFAQQPPQPPAPLEARFREALFAEEGRLDLEKAAQTYQELLAAFDQDRAIAASALFRLAEVQRKLNQPDAARASLRRLVREFPDREPLARLARENLKALGDPAADLEPGAAPVPSVAADPAAEEELARLQALAKNSPDLLLGDNLSSADGSRSAMVDALQKGRVRVVTFLLDNGGKVEGAPGGPTPLSIAAESGHKAVVELLLDRGAKLEPSAAQAAIRGKRVIILKLLLERGLKARGAGLLETALRKSQPSTEIIELLLDSGADPNEEVTCYTQNFSVPLYKGVLDQKPTPRKNGSEEIKMPALAAACVREQPDIVKLLVERGAGVNAVLQGGSSALELACLFDQPEIVETLLKAGADAKHIAPGGVRLTDIAAYHCNPKIYRLLRDAGAEAQGAGLSGKTLWYFLISSYRNFKHDAKQALEFSVAAIADGVNFNGLNDEEDPFLAAVWSGNLEAVKFFLNAGADVKREGRTPVMVAAVKAGLIEKREERTSVNGIPVIPTTFSGTAMDLLRTLLAAGADLDATNTQEERLIQTVGQSLSRATAFHHLVAASPDAITLEAFLSLDPDPHVMARIPEWNDRGCRPVELVVAFGGAILPQNELRRRLWEYTWLEHTPDRTKSVWFNSNPFFTASNFIWHGTFTAAGEHGQTLNVAEALAFIYQRRQEQSQPLMSPDFQNLTILRMDPATGKTASKETVNLQALLEKGDTSTLPVLRPGDILDASRETGDSKDYVADWRAFPEPLPGLFRKALTRRVTVKAGDWTRTFQVLPAREDFRWDPATDKLSADCTPASLLRFLPKPEFFYQMNAVTVRQPGKEPVTLDFTNPDADAAAKTERLAEGAEIVLTALPEDSPELKKRLSQGIFISRGEDGFLREIFRVKDVPEGVENRVILKDVLAGAWDEGLWLLPFSSFREIKILGNKSNLTPENPFEPDIYQPLGGGSVVDLPRDAGSKAGIWNIKEWQEDITHPKTLHLSVVLRNRSEQMMELTPRRAMYQFTEEGWIRENQTVNTDHFGGPLKVPVRSRSMEDVLKAIIDPGSSQKGLVELRLEGSKEALWIDLEKDVPLIMLDGGDTLLLEPGVLLRDFSPPPPPQPAPAPKRRTVLPTD